ncbi:hypothetical protein STENM223S_10824 [Streptomyces tendae]
MVGTKVRALADRGAPRDLIDVFAASRRWTNAELEEFGRRHARGRFEREDLQANLTGAEWTDDEAFSAYGHTRASRALLSASPILPGSTDTYVPRCGIFRTARCPRDHRQLPPGRVGAGSVGGTGSGGDDGWGGARRSPRPWANW